MYKEDTEWGTICAHNGILLVVPYNNPWAWMNRQAVAYTDEIVDVLMAHYQLPEDLPIVSTGGSMGGQSALVYTKYAKRTPAACVANCPVCDMPYHFTERPDLPRTLYSAFFHEPGTMDDALKRVSPLHLAETMPDVSYHLFHCDADLSVNIDRHSRAFVMKMLRTNHHITFDIVPAKGHCDLTPQAHEKYRSYICNTILQRSEP